MATISQNKPSVFSKNDLITAANMNSIGSSFYNQIDEGDHGYGSWSGTYYFLCTRLSGQQITVISAQFGWNSSCYIYLDRYENGGWVQKDAKSGTSGWWSWSYDKGNFVSYGPGYYRLRYSLGHFSYMKTLLYNSRYDSTRGNLLRMVGDMGISESDNKSFSSCAGELITSDALNGGRVYTD